MNNLKRFEFIDRYVDYINSTALLPNVSFVKETQKVFYNPKPNGPSLLPLKFKPYYNVEWEEYDMFEDSYKDESNKEYNAAIYNTIVSLINDGTVNNLYKLDSVVLYIEMDEVTEVIVSTAFDYIDPLDPEYYSRYEEYSDGEYIVLHGYSNESVEWIYLYADGSIRVRLGD